MKCKRYKTFQVHLINASKELKFRHWRASSTIKNTGHFFPEDLGSVSNTHDVVHNHL